jgi:formiminotetrahydrofolate cyclodeaminase
MGGKMAVGGLRAGVEPFVEQLAAPTAAPGGGSASAAAGAMAAGLGAMVAGMSRGKKAYVQHEREHSEAIARLSQLREQLKAAIDEDANAFKAVMAAFKAAKDGGDGAGAINKAMREATLVPFKVAEMAAEVRNIIERLKPITNPKAASDLAVGGYLCEAALKGALENVEINLVESEDKQFVDEMRKKVAGLKK